MPRYSHFAHVADPGVFTRKITPEHAERIVRMKEERGLTWGAIAAWFTRNQMPVTYKTVRGAYHRTRAA